MLAFLPSAPYGDVASSSFFLPSFAPPMPTAQPGFLTAAQLASIQSTVLQSLPWFGTRLVNTPVPDGSGDQKDNWRPVAVYNCDVELSGEADEIVVGGQVVAAGDYLITLPWNAVIEPENRLLVNGVTYEIKNRLTNWTDQSLVQVSAEEVQL